MNPPVLTREDAQADAAKKLRGVEEPGSCEKKIGDAQADIHWVEEAAEVVALLVSYLGTQVEQHFGNIDFDRADFIACSAERRRIGQRLRVLHLHQLGCENGAHWPRL